MLEVLAAVLLAAAPPAPAAATSAPQAPIWDVGSERIRLISAPITVPATAGVVRFREATEASGAGSGLDNMLQYESADRQVFATVYAYYPGLPDAGLTAFMTNRAIRQQSPNVTATGTSVTTAGGHPQAAIIANYSGYRDRLASSAAFVKAGRWIVVVRVSGPDARHAEVDAAMAAFLSEARFDGGAAPRIVAPFTIRDCDAAPPHPARALPLGAVEAAADATIIGTFDGAGEAAHDGNSGGTTILPARVGRLWCAPIALHIGDSVYAVLRRDPADRATGSIDGRTILLVPINDAGTTLELVERLDGHSAQLLYHEIGQTTLLGRYDGALTNEQIADILTGADSDGTRIRAVVHLRPGGQTNIEIPPDDSPAGGGTDQAHGAAASRPR